MLPPARRRWGTSVAPDATHVPHSRAASDWFEAAAAAGERFVASRLAELEVRRVLRSLGLGRAAQDVASEYLDEFTLVSVADDLLQAAAIEFPLGGADAIHVATALRLGPAAVALVTHDAQMARAAISRGFDVLDPVSDDPGRWPVDGIAPRG